jgi:hypothetical protein
VVVDHRQRRHARRQGAEGEHRLCVEQDDGVELLEALVVPGEQLEVAQADEHLVDAAPDAPLDRHTDPGPLELGAQEVAEGQAAGECVGVGVLVGGDEDVLLAGQQLQQLAGAGPVTGAAFHGNG